MTAFEDFVNLELPRRPALLLSSDPAVAYDGNPNDGGAPAILNNAPAGTSYLRTPSSRFYRKDSLGFWLEDNALMSGRVTLYVDPVGGSDDNPGTEALPLQTIYAATLRQNPAGINLIILEDGDHALTDIYAQEGNDFSTKEAQLLFSSKGTVLRGRNRTTVQSITITSWTDPGGVPTVANVSEALTPDALIGTMMYVETFPGFFQAFIVIDNDASSVTFALTSTANGGFLNVNTTIGTGVFNLEVPSARVISSATNNTFFTNRLFYGGDVTFEQVDFDMAANGGFRGPTSRGQGSVAAFNFCRFTGGWSTAIEDAGSLTVTGCYFDGGGAANITCIGKFGGTLTLSGENVFRHTTTAVFVGSGSQVATSSGSTIWSVGCFLWAVIENGSIKDFSYRCYLEDGPYGNENFIRFDAQGNYDRQNNPLRQIGSFAFNIVFDFTASRGDVNLQNGAGTVLVGTPTLARMSGQSFTLADYLTVGAIMDQRNNAISG